MGTGWRRGAMGLGALMALAVIAWEALPPERTLRIPSADLQPLEGYQYAWKLPVSGPFTDVDADDNDHPSRSVLRLREDGRLIGPAHAMHDDIRARGGGAYSHWAGYLRFSSSDGSDPRTGGRKYEIVLRLGPPRNVARLAVLFLIGALGWHAIAAYRRDPASITRWGGGAIVVVVFVVIASAAVRWAGAGWAEPVSLIRSSLAQMRAEVLGNLLLSPTFYAGVAAILLLERLLPAARRQRLLTVGLAQDVVWMIVLTTLHATFIATYYEILRSIYRDRLAFLTVESIAALPEVVRFVWGVLVADFVAWFHHWVRHKVSWFWHFHTIHHSQRELNQFTSYRYHVVEYLVSLTIVVVPLLMLQVSMPNVIAFAVFYEWYIRFYHANIRANLGPLGWILVTPQSHRIHHSTDPRHADTNLGVLFSIWDRLFGTQYPGRDEYPLTGIRDPEFPHETTVRGFGLLRTTLAQFAYPFRSLMQAWRRASPTAPRPVGA